MTNIRQPIVTVAGHVDHGKTSILDKIRGTSIQEGEAGGITQKISFTTLPKKNIESRAGTTLEKFKIPVEIPGLLFIDTPGHAAFTNLRKRISINRHQRRYKTTNSRSPTNPKSKQNTFHYRAK
jgi:translation initiation factor 5B